MKNGIDYFPLDVALDDKFELIEAEFGMDGFAVVIKLLQKIYGGNGYYCEWNTEVALLFAKKACFQLSAQKVSKIVEACIERGIFHKGLFHKYGILTSSGIQKRYFEAACRRKSLEADGRFLLISIKKYVKITDINLVNEDTKNADISAKNVDISAKNANILPKNENRTKQRKGEERKEEERKEKGEGLPHAEHSAELEKTSLGEFGNVRLTQAEQERLQDRLGKNMACEYINHLDCYIESTGKEYKNHYAVMTRWFREDQKKSRLPKNNGPVEEYDFEKLERLAMQKLIQEEWEEENDGSNQR